MPSSTQKLRGYLFFLRKFKLIKNKEIKNNPKTTKIKLGLTLVFLRLEKASVNPQAAIISKKGKRGEALVKWGLGRVREAGIRAIRIRTKISFISFCLIDLRAKKNPSNNKGRIKNSWVFKKNGGVK